MPQADHTAAIAALEARASAAQKLIEYAPRPFVIEFAGTPKAGKSTSVEAIRHFFTRAGFRVHVLVERASLCPIPMKGHLFFNTWCASTMLAELLANIDTEADIIIVDRGLFDALVWLTMQRQRGEVTDAEASIIENFLLLDRWRKLTDLAVVMNVTADMAMMRENDQRITSRPGSIMNPDVLNSISDSVDQAVISYGSKFGSIIQHNTSGENAKSSNVRLASTILEHIERFLNPEILVLPRELVVDLKTHHIDGLSESAKNALIQTIIKGGIACQRATAEQDANLVQVVASGVLIHNDEVFVFQRKDRDPKYQLYGKATLWQGTHINFIQGKSIADIEAALVDRISRYLFLSRDFRLDFAGFCWDQDNDKSSRHIGLIFYVRIDNEHTATDLRKKEFKRGRGHGLAGRFMRWNDVNDRKEDLQLETWSNALLSSVREQRK